MSQATVNTNNLLGFNRRNPYERNPLKITEYASSHPWLKMFQNGKWLKAGRMLLGNVMYSCPGSDSLPQAPSLAVSVGILSDRTL